MDKMEHEETDPAAVSKQSAAADAAAVISVAKGNGNGGMEHGEIHGDETEEGEMDPNKLESLRMPKTDK